MLDYRITRTSFLSTFSTLQVMRFLCISVVARETAHCLLSSRVTAAPLSLERGGIHCTSPYMGCSITRRGTGVVLSGMKCNGVHRPTVSNILHQNIPSVHIPYACCGVCSLDRWSGLEKAKVEMDFKEKRFKLR